MRIRELKDKVQRHKELCESLNDLYAKKNHDYGDSFHLTFVEEGMAMARIRLGDKFNRFKTLSRGDRQEVSDESIKDTLIDLANYAIMTVLEMEVSEDGRE
jgi:iron uptake system EfeUOB component EfeO/EfeM